MSLKRNTGLKHVCLEFSSCLEFGGLTPRRKIALCYIDGFTEGQERSVDLVSLDTSGSWRWATSNGGREPIISTTHFCRLEFSSDNEPPDYFHFLLDFCENKDLRTLRLIGENKFSYASEWATENDYAM